MVSIVIVSHSAGLAEGVRDLAAQMVHGRVPLAVAGGTDDRDNPIGTDALKVQAAIVSVYSPDGVLVLMDLGSALLSAEMALEFLSPEQREHVYLCPAALVEGTVAAAVQASLGADIHQVLREARGALIPKISQLESAESQDVPPATPTLPIGERAIQDSETPSRKFWTFREGHSPSVQLTVRNKMGLHARPAANLVKTAGRYAAEIWVSKGAKRASAKSINQIATLGVRQGDPITITAVGPDAGAALAALQSLAEANFGRPGEADEAGTPPEPAASAAFPASSTDELAGIPASPGIAIGPVFQYQPRLPDIAAYQAADTAAEWTRLEAAIATARRDIQVLQSTAARQVGAGQAAIFEAHALFLQDPALLGAAKARIFEAGLNAEAAWLAAVEALADDYRALEDEYQRGRAADVLDVGGRVLRQLVQAGPPALDVERPSILVAPDVTPSETARLDPTKVLGICTEMGGATSHSAILARALGIPSIAGLSGATRYLRDGQIVAIDGTAGRVWPHPDQATLRELEARREQWQQEQRQARAAGQGPAVTQDGQVVQVVANIAGLSDADAALEFGAEGVGVFRTEFLFMDRTGPPTEEEQLAAYRRVADTMGTRPLVIRTLDVGGDKRLPYLDSAVEMNPFLGWRGIRFCLDHPEIFKTQLRAILRASPGHHIQVLFPMISTPSELRAAKNLLATVEEELQSAGIAFDRDMAVGVMIEVPSAVTVADQLAGEADFFSIGSNDLAQYAMAADRGNERVSPLADALQPAVLRLIAQTVQSAHAAGIPVAVCGELAGDPLAAPLLVGLGVDELSMNAPNIPAVKQAIRGLSLARARQVAGEILALETVEAVQDYLSTASSISNSVPNACKSAST